MRIKFLIAVVGVVMASDAASAADLPMPAPIPVEFGGWYLRGDIGFSNQRVKNVRSADSSLYNGVAVSQTSNFDTAGVYGLGVGYQFNSWFRADVTGQYRGSANFKGIDTLGAGGLSATDQYNGSKSELLFLANAYVDLGTWWAITPFVGAGIGAARVSISDFSDTGDFPNGFGTCASGPGCHSFTVGRNASRWNFAWAAHAGLAYKATPNLTLELAYSYVDMGKGVTGSSYAYDGSFTNGAPFVFKDITSHDITLGLRWALDPMPAYYAPPLFTKG